MESLVEFITKNPGSALIAVSLALACLFAYLLFQSFKDRVRSIETILDAMVSRTEAFGESIRKDLSNLKHALYEHQDSMGKATKAINGDVLQIKEKMFEVKLELMTEVERLEKLLEQSRHNLQLANENSRMAVDTLAQKLGRVIVIEEGLRTQEQRVKEVEQRIKAGESVNDTHRKWFSAVAQTLQKHKESLDIIQKAKKGE